MPLRLDLGGQVAHRHQNELIAEERKSRQGNDERSKVEWKENMAVERKEEIFSVARYVGKIEVSSKIWNSFYGADLPLYLVSLSRSLAAQPPVSIIISFLAAEYAAIG